MILVGLVRVGGADQILVITLGVNLTRVTGSMTGTNTTCCQKHVECHSVLLGAVCAAPKVQPSTDLETLEKPKTWLK